MPATKLAESEIVPARIAPQLRSASSSPKAGASANAAGAEATALPANTEIHASQGEGSPTDRAEFLLKLVILLKTELPPICATVERLVLTHSSTQQGSNQSVQASSCDAQGGVVKG